MTQQELLSKVASISGETRKSVESVLKTAADVIASTLEEGGEVTLPGLGKFVTQQKDARDARNPATGATIHVPAHKAVKFRAAKVLKDAVAG